MRAKERKEAMKEQKIRMELDVTERSCTKNFWGHINVGCRTADYTENPGH